MIKKYIIGLFLALSMPALVAYAATPILTVSGNSDTSVTVNVTGGEINAPVQLFYYSPSTGLYQSYSLGTTNANGTYSGTVSAGSFNNLSSNMSMPVYVQVGGYQSNTSAWPYLWNTPSGNGNTATNSNTTSSGIMFSQNSPNISPGQNGSIILSGGSGTYYIASNSNANGVTPSISGNTLTLYGGTAGQANIVVCSTSGGCGTLMINVNGVNGNGSNTSTMPTLSSSNMMVTQGGQGSITLSGGTGPYTASIVNGTGVSTTLTGNTLYVNGNATGTNTINVCSANNGGCTPLMVTVQSQATTGTSGTTSGISNGGMSFTLPLTMGQALSLQLTGGNGGYYLQSPMSSPALASINGNTLMLNGSALGSGTVTICQTGGSICLPISFTVNQAAQLNSNASLTGTGGGYFFDYDLGIGSSGPDVLELQNRLREEGYFTATPTGYFGSITASAVMKYQAAHGIPTTGYVGPMTRAELNR